MNLKELADAIGARPLCGEENITSVPVNYLYASDLMSDVLAFCVPGSVLLTGLTNIQIVRTAQMMDIPAIVFVRDKLPLEETIHLAQENGILLLVSPRTMYETCGILYKEGVPACPIPSRRD